MQGDLGKGVAKPEARSHAGTSESWLRVAENGNEESKNETEIGVHKCFGEKISRP